MIGIGKTFTGAFVATIALAVALFVGYELRPAATFRTTDLVVDHNINNSTETFIALGAGTFNNVDLWSGGAHTSRVEIDPSANSPTLTGIVAGSEGDLLLLWNGGFPGACNTASVVGALCDEITLVNNSGSSLVNNRIWTANGKNLNIPNNDGVLLIYDGGFGWTVFGGATTTIRAQQLSLDPVAIPTALINGSTNDNYNPWGATSVTSHVRQDTGATSTVTGLVAAGAPNADSRIVVFENISATGTITFAHNNGGSIPANRFLLPGGAPLLIGPLGSVTFIYDQTVSMWRVQAHT